ncbi:hypothetical protein OROGR_001845 [Orobanche gracilis]
MWNGRTASIAGEFSDDDVEKQRMREAEDGVEKIIDVVVVDCPNKGEHQMESSPASQEECRADSEKLRKEDPIGCYVGIFHLTNFVLVCQEENEEVLINLGCRCRGGLAKAHQSCLIKWFNSRGSNKQIAANVAPPDSQTSYWVWRVDRESRSQEHERRCFSPLWVAFSILIGGLLLDVLISITLGVSALPVNIIIGVIVVLGLGTALRLALEFCQEWNVRRAVQRVEANASIGYRPAV